MSDSPLSKKTAALIFEDMKPDPHGAVGQDIPLATSATVFVDSAGILTMRIATSMKDVQTFALAPYSAARLAYSLAEIANATGQYAITMDVVDADDGRTLSLRAPSTRKN